MLFDAWFDTRALHHKIEIFCLDKQVGKGYPDLVKMESFDKKKHGLLFYAKDYQQT